MTMLVFSSRHIGLPLRVELHQLDSGGRTPPLRMELHLLDSGGQTPPLRVEQLVVIPLLGVIADILDYFVIGMLTANNMFVIVTLPETDMKRREDPILNTTYIFIGSHSLKPLNNLV